MEELDQIQNDYEALVKVVTSQQKQIDDLKKIVDFFVAPDRYIFKRDIELFNGLAIRAASGLKLGKAVTDKIGLYGVTPVVQAGSISSPAGGTTIDSQARTAIDSIRLAIKGIGITA